jgi:hypothetical protein
MHSLGSISAIVSEKKIYKLMEEEEEPRKLGHRDVWEFTLFSFRARTFISILACASVKIASDTRVL